MAEEVLNTTKWQYPETEIKPPPDNILTIPKIIGRLFPEFDAVDRFKMIKRMDFVNQLLKDSINENNPPDVVIGGIPPLLAFREKNYTLPERYSPSIYALRQDIQSKFRNDNHLSEAGEGLWDVIDGPKIHFQFPHPFTQFMEKSPYLDISGSIRKQIYEKSLVDEKNEKMLSEIEEKRVDSKEFSQRVYEIAEGHDFPLGAEGLNIFNSDEEFEKRKTCIAVRWGIRADSVPFTEISFEYNERWKNPKKGKLSADGVKIISFEFTGPPTEDDMRAFDNSINWNYLPQWDISGSLRIPNSIAWFYRDAQLELASTTIEKQPVVFLRSAVELVNLAVVGENNLLTSEYGIKALTEAFAQYSDSENPSEFCAPAINPDDARGTNRLNSIRKFIFELSKKGIKNSLDEMGAKGIYLREFLDEMKTSLAKSFLYNAPRTWRYLTALNLDLLFPELRIIYGINERNSNNLDPNRLNKIRRDIYNSLLDAVPIPDPSIYQALGYNPDIPQGLSNPLWQREQASNQIYAMKADYRRVKGQLRGLKGKLRSKIEDFLDNFKTGISVAGNILLEKRKERYPYPSRRLDGLEYFFRAFDVTGGEKIQFVPFDEQPDWREFMDADWIDYGYLHNTCQNEFKRSGNKENLLKKEYFLYDHLMKLLIQKSHEIIDNNKKYKFSRPDDPITALLISPELFEKYIQGKIRLDDINQYTDGIVHAENEVIRSGEISHHAELLVINKARSLSNPTLSGWKLVSLIEPCTHYCFKPAYEYGIQEYIYAIPSQTGAFTSGAVKDKLLMGTISTDRELKLRNLWGFRISEVLSILKNYDYKSFTDPAPKHFIDKFNIREKRKVKASGWNHDNRYKDWPESDILNLKPGML